MLDLVRDKSELPAAISMNSSLMNVSRLIGPALAGFIVAAFGEGICFLLNAVSYIAVITALLFMQVKYVSRSRTATKGIFKDLKEGLLYAAVTTPIRAPILLLATVGFAAWRMQCCCRY